MPCSPFATSGSNARKLSRCGSRRSRRHDRIVSQDPDRHRPLAGLRSESRGGVPRPRAEGPGSGEVTAVSLAPSAGKAEVVIAVRGAVDVRDFVLASPDRLVLDVVGAKLSDAAPAVYDGVKRGGVLNLRYSQFRPDVVRIVIDLDAAKTYEVIAPGRVDQDRLRLRPGLPGLVVGRGRTPSWSTDEEPAKAPEVRRRRKPSLARCPRGVGRPRGAPDHRDLGPRQHRRRGRRLRRLQRPHHHHRQGRQGRSHRRGEEPALADGVPGDPGEPGPLRPGDVGRDHPGGRAGRARPRSTRSSRWRPASSGSTTPTPARWRRRSRAS